jgi:alkylated DNA repair dioxygenase AlkB
MTTDIDVTHVVAVGKRRTHLGSGRCSLDLENDDTQYGYLTDDHRVTKRHRFLPAEGDDEEEDEEEEKVKSTEPSNPDLVLMQPPTHTTVKVLQRGMVLIQNALTPSQQLEWIRWALNDLKICKKEHRCQNEKAKNMHMMTLTVPSTSSTSSLVTATKIQHASSDGASSSTTSSAVYAGTIQPSGSSKDTAVKGPATFHHPQTPPIIPDFILNLTTQLTQLAARHSTPLNPTYNLHKLVVNFYKPFQDTRLSFHDELGKKGAVVSISMGDDAVFAYADSWRDVEKVMSKSKKAAAAAAAASKKNGTTTAEQEGPQGAQGRGGDLVKRLTLRNGDVLIFGGPSRGVVHGVERIIPNTAPEHVKKVLMGRLNFNVRER